MEIISVLCILADIIWYTSNNVVYSHSIEYDIVLCDGDFNKNLQAK